MEDFRFQQYLIDRRESMRLQELMNLKYSTVPPFPKDNVIRLLEVNHELNYINDTLRHQMLYTPSVGTDYYSLLQRLSELNVLRNALVKEINDREAKIIDARHAYDQRRLEAIHRLRDQTEFRILMKNNIVK